MGNSITRRTFIKHSIAGASGATFLWCLGCSSNPDFDLILVGGLVYDGSGEQPSQLDIGIKDGRISGLGTLRDKSALRKIDVSGLAVAPGFIDFHSHSDDELLLGGDPQSKIRQGVTTEVLGQDGDSMAPLTPEMLKKLDEGLQGRYGVSADWLDFAGYFARLEQSGMISNAISMVGQGTLREYAVGPDDRPATEAEVRKMIDLAQAAFAQGAYGISSGLEYTPGSFASTDEIAAVCASMKGQGIYSTHMRNEDDTVVEALEEAIKIAKWSKSRLNISHMKASGKRNWDKLYLILENMKTSRVKGLPITSDRYPYVAYNTGLSSLFPLWSRDGGKDAFVGRLRDKSLHPRLRETVLGKIEKIGGWEAVVVSSIPDNPDRANLEGRNMADLTAGGKDPFQYLVDLVLTEDGGGDMVGFAMSEDNTSRLLANPYNMIASDGSALGTEGKLLRGVPHPRAFGTFPRVLGKYVREDGIMSLQEAIRKMTSLPALALRLKDRGQIREGFAADLVAFDAATVIDKATFKN
ncbi:MAG TPA: D-aminoacylase, partial [Calditrichia bacterium]|nr:D-aminoacylase [Calditrichia bacterium]